MSSAAKRRRKETGTAGRCSSPRRRIRCEGLLDDLGVLESQLMFEHKKPRPGGSFRTCEQPPISFALLVSEPLRLKQWARWLAVQIPFCGLHVAARVKLVFHGGDCTRNAVN